MNEDTVGDRLAAVSSGVSRRHRAAGSTGVRDRAPLEGATTFEVGAADVVAFLERSARILRRHRRLLDRLDAELGDGDHGENMAVGFETVVRALGDETEADVSDLLRRAGHLLVASVGGASGPLYGTAFIEAGFRLGAATRVGGATRVDARELALAFQAAAAGLARRGRCGLGDKTIFDALAPAVAAFVAALDEGRQPADAFRRAAFAARHGMRATIPLVARRGLALRLGERSRGHQDPGATSCFLLVRAMVDPTIGGSAGWSP